MLPAASIEAIGSNSHHSAGSWVRPTCFLHSCISTNSSRMMAMCNWSVNELFGVKKMATAISQNPSTPK